MRARSARIDVRDNVAVALADLAAGDVEQGVTVREAIASGHKFALAGIESGTDIIKFGFPIARATVAIRAGEHVHTHNAATRLSGTEDYRYEPGESSRVASQGEAGRTFEGYLRADGRAATRNEIWIINTVGCVNQTAQRIAAISTERFGDKVDGIYAFGHQFGCSQLGDDALKTRRVLAGLMRNPNAGGVLVLGLGCETNQLAALLDEAGLSASERIRAFNSQAVGDEVEAGVAEIAALVALMENDRRQTLPVSQLVVGVKCGGSDGLSGITANPAVGRVSDLLTSGGASVLLTETPEMFGAEHILMNRAADEQVFGDVVTLINDFKAYYLDHDQPVYENPSPGNKAGGITTLEEKSLGAIQKGGRATVTGVLQYGEAVSRPGLSLLEAPGNDAVSSTALIASGATVLLFTTGRGTPLGFPVPTIKISSNTDIATLKSHWIDFDAGRATSGVSIDALGEELLDDVVAVASGKLTRNETAGFREIAIWKDGVTV